LHNPPLRSVSRPIGEAFAFACWASGLTKQSISGKLTLSQLQDEEKTTGISPKFQETEPSGSDSAVWQTGTKTGICNLVWLERGESLDQGLYLVMACDLALHDNDGMGVVLYDFALYDMT
jgi:hypothetical protein